MVQLPFLKKKEQPAKSFISAERVNELAGRGFSEPEMIDVLRKEGYTPEAIDNALTQSIKMNVTSEPKPQSTIETKDDGLPTLEELTPKAEMPQMPESPLPQQYYQQQYPTEDYVDYIVQSRVAEVNEKLNEFDIRHQEMEKRMESISQQLNQLLQTRSGEHQQILSRIDNFNDTLNDVNTRIGSLEKIFKETLPALIESVRALSSLVQMMKREA
ncbi:MAG: hypothetical protein HY361_03650 [Candidatus Aenigmarchaeota archaeon]|nr:hypothetical protein [Candidatus Aenigmarchaeota archaeon]